MDYEEVSHGMKNSKGKLRFAGKVSKIREDLAPAYIMSGKSCLTKMENTHVMRKAYKL